MINDFTSSFKMIILYTLRLFFDYAVEETDGHICVIQTLILQVMRDVSRDETWSNIFLTVSA